MQNKKKLGLVLCLVALLVIGTLCLSACTKKDTRSTITFQGVEEIHAPVGTVTEESLLAGVTAVDGNGKDKKVTLDLEGADLTKPGRYLITYKAGDNVKREAVYLYGDISFQINGQNLEGDKLEIPFATAITSLHFAKIATATDSFGNEIVATLVEGDMFDYAVGEYTVKYSATDKAGQTVEKTVTYTVTSDIEMTVQSGVSVKYEQESVNFKVDLDGEKDVWLMANGGLVSITDYLVTEKGLELKASYYRTLAPGENTLKICSVNGSTEFTFTVVDTGKPLFTFDSIYKTNIIAGNAAVYEMPKTQIMGHEYSYTFKVTKDGVTYKAQQVGDSILFTTSSGKNLTPGIYDITVTATNKADTSKKTTIKRDFRIYTNQAEIDGWAFWHSPAHVSMVNVDLSDDGYYRTSYKYDAKSPGSWNTRMQWNGAAKETFQSVTFDFYVYSLGIAEVENGPVKYVGKKDKASIPFSASTMSGEGIAMMFYDMNGKVVNKDELMMNTWYTVKLDMSEFKNEKTDIYWANGVSNKWQVGMYITEMHFWAYEGSGTQNVFRDEAKTATIQRNGGKSSFTSGKVDDESVWLYTVSEKHMPSTPLKRALKVTTNKSKEVISIDFKFLEDPKDVHGNVLKPTMFVHDVDYRNDFVFGANYTIVDETGDPVETPEVGKWYTLYITTHGRENYLIYPMAEITEQITCKMAYKNLQTYDLDLGNVTMRSDFGNVSRVSLYKTGEGNWEYSFISYSGWCNYPNDPWRRRPLITVKGDVSEVRFQFMFETAEYLPKESTVYVDWLELFASVEGSGPSHPALTTTILDADFNPVKREDMQKGVWYTAVVTTSAGVNLQPQFNLLPGGSSKTGGVDDQVFNMELKIRDLIAIEAEKIPVYSNEDDTATIERKGSKSELDPIEGETGAWRYIVDKTHVPSSAIQRALKVTTDGSKEVISIDVMFNGDAKDLEENVLAPFVYVHDVDYRSDGVFGANYVTVDAATGEPCGNMEVGKWYTIYITTFGRESFLIYPLGNITTQLTCDISFKNLKTYDMDTIAVQPMTYNGNAAQLSLYKAADESWQFGYTSYTDWCGTDNNAWNRRATLIVPKDGTVSEIRFRYKFTTADYYYPGDVEKDEEEVMHSQIPTLLASVEGNHPALTTVIYDENFNVVAADKRELGKWYYGVVTRADGQNFEHDFCLLIGGYADASAEKTVNIDMVLHDFVAVKPTTAYTLGEVTMQSAGMVDALAAESGAVRYVLTKEEAAATTFPSDRAFKVSLNGETKGLLKMELTVNSAKDQNDQDVNPWLMVQNANGWNSFIVTDTDGNVVKNLEAGKTYYLFITTGDNTSFMVYPTGKNGEKIAADVTFKSATVSAIEDKFIQITAPEKFANVSFYEDANGQQYAYQSDTAMTVGNNAWQRRFQIKLDSDKYLSISFRMRYVESTFGGTTMHSLQINGGTYPATFYDESFNVVAEKDLQDGVWYNVIVTRPDGSAFPVDIPHNYTVTQANDQFVSVLFQIADIKGVLAEETVAHDIADGNITVQAAGAFETLTKDETTGKIAYKLAADKAPYSALDKGIKLTLNDTGKQIIALKFTVASAKSMLGEDIGAWVRVDNKAGYDGNYVVIDENGDMCKEVVAGKSYTLFITTPENITEIPNLFGQPAVSNEFVVYLLGKDGPQSGELTIDGVELYEEAGITADDKTITYQTHMIHNNVSYYKVGNTWNLAYSANSAMYRSSPTPTNCTAEARCTKFYFPEGSFDALMMRVRFVDADNKGTLDVNFASWGQSVAFYQNGVAVPAANRKLGEWYDVVIIKSGASVDNGASYYPQGYTNGNSADYTSVMMQMADFQLLTPDTNPVKVVVRDATNLNMLRKVVNGENVYITTTRGASNPGTGAWQWGTGIEVPLGNKYFAVTFRIMEAYAEDGVTPIDPTMSVWRKDLVSGTTAYIYDAETGAMVSNDNGNYNRGQKLELGKWYTVVSNVPIAENTRHYLFPCQQYTGKALITMEIKDRACTEDIGNGVTVTTPDAYANPYPVYTKNDGWNYTIYENGSSYNAWQRRTDFGGAVVGAAQVEFEVRINSISGACTAQFGTTETRREFYDIETGEYLGYDNHVTLEIGKWYKVVATNGDKGAAMGDFFRCYPGNASTDGNVSISFRNFEVKAAAEVIISFNLNGVAGTAPAAITITNGSAYGTLPTLTAPEGYIFGGWYKDAACSGNAVSATDIATGSHTLYAKWSIVEDTNPIKVVVRDVTNLNMTTAYVDGRHIYTTTTRGVSNPGTNAWQWGTGVEVPLGSKYFAVTFRITEAYAADGVTPIDPTMSVWRKDLSSGTSAQIYDAETGEQVSNDNGNYARGQKLELGKWYIVVSDVPIAENTRHYLFPCQQYTGKALITVEIADRICTADISNGVTVTTPDSYANPYPVYNVNDGWNYTIFNDGKSYNAWQRRTDFGGVAGAMAVSFEVRINSISGACTAQFGTTETRREFYDIETGEYLGYDNNVTLEIGKWYKVVATNGNQGAVMGESFRCYPGNASTDGNVSISFRNFEILKEEVIFTTPGSLADPEMSVVDGGIQYSITGNSVAGLQRKLNVAIANADATQLAFEFKLSNISGRATASMGTPATDLAAKFYNAEGVEVTSLTADAWYKMVITKKDGSALGSESFLVGTVGGTATLAGSADLVIRNVVVTAP